MGAIKVRVSREYLADRLMLNTSEAGRVEIAKVIDCPELGAVDFVLYNKAFPACEYGKEPQLAIPVIQHTEDYIKDWGIVDKCVTEMLYHA